MSKVLGRFGQCMNNFIIAQNADVVHPKRKILKKDAPKIGVPGAAGSTSGKEAYVREPKELRDIMARFHREADAMYKERGMTKK